MSCASVCLAKAKKGYPPWTACRAFHVDREWRNYKEIIITWLYLHRYRSRDTDTWCSTLCFLGRGEDCIVFLQICRNMMQSSQQTRGIHPILFQCWANYGDADQHWDSIGCVALCLLGSVTASRPNARAVYTSTLLVGLQLMSRSRVTRDVTELT